jgi:hypothetical protein
MLKNTPPDMTANEQIVYDGLNFGATEFYMSSKNAGWYTDIKTDLPIERNFGEVIALMHSELSEALEAHRKDLMDDKLPHRSGIEVELADCVIRILDTAGAMGLDIGGAVIEKQRYNRTRVDHSLAARKAGGKKY